MKKTWQWIIEYRREIEPDSDYQQEMVEQLLTWKDTNPHADIPPHLWGYESYLKWVPFTESMFQQIQLSRASSTSSGAMKPRHLNDCLAVLASILNSGPDPNATGHQQRIYEMKRRMGKTHLRIFNVKTDEVIPGEIM